MLSYKTNKNKYQLPYLLSSWLLLMSIPILIGCQEEFFGIRATVWLTPIPQPKPPTPEPISNSEEEMEVTIDLTKPTLRETKEWICSGCNFRNSNKTKTCVICKEINVDESKEWKCAQCTYLNHLLVENCEICEGERPPCADPAYYDSSSETSEDAEEDIEAVCPICMEEERLEMEGNYECKQCKKSICKPCYQDILKSANKICPLCRYEHYITQQ